MSLASVSVREGRGLRGEEMAGLSLHDLHLEFLSGTSENRNRGGSVWHDGLLQGYLERSSDGLCCDPCTLSSSAVMRWRFGADGCFIGREVDECAG